MVCPPVSLGLAIGWLAAGIDIGITHVQLRHEVSDGESASLEDAGKKSGKAVTTSGDEEAKMKTRPRTKANPSTKPQQTARRSYMPVEAFHSNFIVSGHFGSI